MSTVELSQSGPALRRMPAESVELPRLPVVSNTADTAIRASSRAVVLAVAGNHGVHISCWYAYPASLAVNVDQGWSLAWSARPQPHSPQSR